MSLDSRKHSKADNVLASGGVKALLAYTKQLESAPPEVGRIDGLKRALQILSEEYGNDAEALIGFKRIQKEIDG